jgi:hypothetical protein
MFPTKKPSRSEVLTFVALYAIAILTTRAIGRGHFDDLRPGGLRLAYNVGPPRLLSWFITRFSMVYGRYIIYL